jgi:hypothetical protein
MKKRGQFFLIAALIIVSVIITLGLVYNEVTTSNEDQTVYDLSSEIRDEGARVIDHGTFNSLNDSNVTDHLKNLLSDYSILHPDKDIFIIYGDERNVGYFNYSHAYVGSTNIGSAGNPIWRESEDKGSIRPTDGEVIAYLGNETYTFNLRKGYNFYLIVEKEGNNEKVIAQK